MCNKNIQCIFMDEVYNPYIPTNPHNSFILYNELIKRFNKSFKKNRILTIGFLGKSALISKFVASQVKNCVYSLQTIKTCIDNKEPLIYFNEDSDCISTHYIYADLNNIPKFDSVLFVIDKFKTEEIVFSCISALNNIIPNLRYTIATLVNLQSKETKSLLEDKNIKVYSIFDDILTSYFSNLKLLPIINELSESKKTPEYENKILIGYYKTNSKICSFSIEQSNNKPIKIKTYVNILYKDFKTLLDKEISLHNTDILVLCFEEFSFISMVFSYMIQKYYKVNSYFQSFSTVNMQNNNSSNSIINNINTLITLDNDSQNYYLYNLKKYDNVFLFTNNKVNDGFILEISNILRKYGCRKLTIIYFNIGN